MQAENSADSTINANHHSQWLFTFWWLMIIWPTNVWAWQFSNRAERGYKQLHEASELHVTRATRGSPMCFRCICKSLGCLDCMTRCIVWVRWGLGPSHSKHLFVLTFGFKSCNVHRIVHLRPYVHMRTHTCNMFNRTYNLYVNVNIYIYNYIYMCTAYVI